MLLLPTKFDGTARYTFECDLDDVTFVFAFEWNDRDDGWYMSITDVSGVPLLSGRRVVLSYPLINIYRQAGFPVGDLIAIDTSGTDTEPGLLDLGDRVQLLYVSLDELKAL